MRPISLYMSDYMNHKKSDISFSSFKSAIIVGKTKNNDAISNGVGKSTIFSAIEWALFNKVHKTTLDTIVREGAKKCIVEFCFEIGGSEFKIHRSLSFKGTKNIYFYEKINGEWETISQRTPTETEEKIQETIKITHKAFQYSVLFRQADLSGLVEDEKGGESNNSKRIDILKEPLNLMRYSKKEKIAQELAKPIRKDIAVKESAAEILGNPDQDILKSEEELTKCLEQISEKDHLIKTDLYISLNEKQKNLQELKSTLSASDADIHQKVEDQHLKVKKLNYSIKDLGESHKKILATIDSNNLLLTSRRQTLDKLIIDLSNKEGESHRDINKISNEHKKVGEDELKGSKLLSRAEVELEYAKKSIPDSDNCPSCQQSITQEYRKEFEEKINKVLIEKQDDIDFYKKQLSKCKSVKVKLFNELDKAKQHVAYIDAINAKIKSAKENISIYEATISNAEKDAKNVEQNLDTQSKELEEVIKHNNNLKEISLKSDLTDLNAKIFSIAREIKVYEQSITSIHTELQSLRTREGILKERINNKKEDKRKLDIINNDLISLRRDLTIHQHVINSFSHKGIPTLIINTCLNELQLEVNKTLQELRPDLEVTFDADLNFTYRRNGIKRDYHQLSHGQHVYIALAFKHGLARVIQKRAGVDIKSIFFDEIDSPLDKAGVESLAVAIKKWQNDFLVLVITHKEELKDNFSHAILVEEGDDGAEARVVTSW